MSTEIVISNDFELIAQAMLMTRGDLAKASRLDSVDHNAMSLRAVVKSNPEIRQRYHELLADEMQEKGLHIAERILKMAELQEAAFGCTIIDSEGNPLDIPADPKTVIELSKEISRLIARALRAAVDLVALGENTITVDCDVIQADGGTRTASITGACVALVDALNHMRAKGIINNNPLKHMIAAVSVGMYQGEAVSDLDYLEDSSADTDMNVVMTETGKLIEVQGTAEEEPFSFDEMQAMLTLAKNSINELFDIQKTALN